ncbi:diacylglycerol O-acyltransferase 2-like protein 6 [Lemur catta]|uniref:diacylglycerol O-acyltransferase 2-like protein 6 n=1 Tax=Lemur catta TaxID=9447 RepID=UPI001E26984D|nr:diacylglycerol O-acyltransferase 2-like protein 6 [Lemur catta]
MAFSRKDAQGGRQTFSVMQWMPFFIIFGFAFAALLPFYLAFTKFWPLTVLALAWLAYDWNTHSQGCRRSAWVRNWTVWKYFRNYFPVKLVKTHDLSPNRNYIIASHPHGILSYGVFINFATEATGFAKIFPSITPSVGTLEGFFWLPILRDFAMWLGTCPVSDASLKYILTQKGVGNAMVIVVGGAAEALLARPGETVLFLKQRKGFVKLALKTGTHIVPCYSFGENDIHQYMNYPEGTWMRSFQTVFQNTCKRFLGTSFRGFSGQGLTPGSWGFLPLSRPITTVVGEPLPIPKIENPDMKTVDKYHALYISALQKLFERYKVECGFPETQELTII